jgi:hypothetical protein
VREYSGRCSIGEGVELDERDALEIVEEDVEIKSSTTSHLFLIEMTKAA